MPRNPLLPALLRPVDAAPLVAFRIGFGVLMLWQTVGDYLLGGRLARNFIHPLFHFKYEGFYWLEPLPPGGMIFVFWAMAAACVGIALGWHYRLSAAVFTLTFGYQFLLDEAWYNNHDYLIALLGFLMLLVPAHAAGSLDARRGRGPAAATVPAWALWLIRFQIAIPYVYGGIAKLDYDWLARAQPLAIWLANPGPHEWRPDILRTEAAAYAMSWGGLALDLLVVPALLWKKSRPYAVAALVSFHLLNSQLFVIGVFPWLMIWATALFLEPETLRRFRLVPRSVGPPGTERATRAAQRKKKARRRETAAADEADSPGLGSAKAKLAAVLLGLYVALQLLVPFRHWLYPGDVDWTEEGHQFAWRMKLRDKRGTLTFTAIDPRTRRTITLTGVEEVLTRKQRAMMRHDPDMIRQFAHRLAEGLRERGAGDMEIRVLSDISLNGLPRQPLIDPQTDLGSQPPSPPSAPWITPGPDPKQD